MSNETQPPKNPRFIWPWFVLAAVVLAAALAFLWISAEVRRVRHYQSFDYRPHPAAPAEVSPKSASSPTPAQTTTIAANTSTNATIAEFLESLNGGDVAVGRRIFLNKPEASCARCHRVDGQGGDNGPALDGIGLRATREFILESLVAPNAVITKGYETVILRLKNGTSVAGILRQESETNLILHTPDDGLTTVNKSDVAERSAGLSPMPGNSGIMLSKTEIRDLVAYLASLTNGVPGK